MFKPPKPTGPQQPNRHKLPLVERPPKQDDISTLFTGALRIRGTLFELPIRPGPLAPVYIVTCIYDHGCNETVWAMYEGSESGVAIFNLPQSDLDMVYDMVCMACKTQETSAFPAEVSQSAAAPAQPYGTPPSQPYGAPPSQPYGAPPSQPYGAPPSQPYGAPPSQPYGAPPAQPYGAPPAQPYGAPPAQPYGAPPAQPYGAPPAQPYGAPPAQPYGTPQYSQGTGSASVPDIPIPDNFSMMDLISKKGIANVLLGQLFLGAGVVNQRCLDSGLKLQELVREGKLNSEQAILAMKRCAELGGHLDEDIIQWAKDPESAQRRAAKPSPAAPPKPAASAAPAPARDNVVTQRIAELLKQSGLVTEEDLEMARNVKARHGGDLNQILVSAGKLSAKTVDAAEEVQNLVAVGRIRIDRAISALHYCERMRVGLKEAMSELNIELS